MAEAEGLADLLAAETESQRVQALGMASGHVSRAVADWQDRLLNLMAGAEAEAGILPTRMMSKWATLSRSV